MKVRGSSLRWSSAQGAVECKLDERHELIERLLLGQPSGGEAIREIQGAVLDGEAPMQRIDVGRERRPKLTRRGIETEIDRAFPGRKLADKGTGDGERPQPREAIG